MKYSKTRLLKSLENVPRQGWSTQKIKDLVDSVYESDINRKYKIIVSGFDFSAIPSGYENSIWEIRHTHDLNAAAVTLPEGVTLRFVGGKLTNYTSITGNETQIEAGFDHIFDTSGVLPGTWNFTEAYPEWFGAVADGATNDTLAIQKVLQFSGNIVFSGGTYDVRFDDLVTTYYNLFPVRSNTNIIFRNNALVKLSGSESAQYCGIFGIDKNNLPVSNVNFTDANIEGFPIETATVNPAGINIMTDPDEPANSITDITVSGGKLSNLAMGVFIMQRTTTGGTTRQANRVRISNVEGEGCVSFLNADGKDIIIKNCIANGRSDLRTAYDGVSVHSGQNVKIIGNTFYNYNTGQVINVRNSSENASGSADVIIAKNYIYDCPTVAIQISLYSISEPVYGVRNISVSNNIVRNCNSGIFISCGSATSGTPWKKITVDNNQFVDMLYNVIWVANNTTIYGRFFQITNNTGNTLADTMGSGLRVRCVTESIISNNNIDCPNITAGITLDANLRPVLTGGVELGVFPCYLDYFQYGIFANNWIHMGNFGIAYTTVITNSQGIDFTGNTIFGKWITDKYIYCKFTGNYFYEIGINNGRTFNPKWEQHNKNVVIETAAPPAALEWFYGDRCINMQPAAGEYAGWVCIQSTVYDEFGALVSNAVWQGYGRIQGSYRTISATYTALITDDIIDCTSGTFPITLPTAVGNAYKKLIIMNNGSGIVTIDGTIVLDTKSIVGVISNGIVWKIDSKYVEHTQALAAATNHAATEKTTLVDADEITGQNSANSFSLIRTTWTNIKVFLKTYFDTIYAPVLGSDDNYVTDAEKAALHAAATIDSGSSALASIDSNQAISFTGASGTYTTADSKTVTVVNGIITEIE
jgi:hypothetical protein